MAVQNTRNQNNTVLIILIIAVLAILGAGAYFLLSGNSKKVVQSRPSGPPAGQIAVPVLREDINLGGRIIARTIRIQYMPPEAVPQDAVIAPENFIGRLAVRSLRAGEYIKQGDFSAEGARPGFSGVTAIGKRVIALSPSVFPENQAFLPGDRIDLLSIGRITEKAGTAPARQRTDVEIARGGRGIGQSGGRRPSRPQGGAIASVTSTSATLIAENVEVLSKNDRLIVLQMEPQDAHVTVLAVASGATMRAIFRPFNDQTRLTPTPNIKVTTRLPKPSADPDLITVFNGSDLSKQRAVSELYRADSENDQAYVPDDNQDIESIEPYIEYVN